jgi:hypothetical protein
MPTTFEPGQERWLSCHVDRGMFSDEFAVTYPSRGTVISSVFVPSSAVVGQAGQAGRVRVRVVGQPGRVFAVLPTPQNDMVPVAESDLSDSP